MENIVKLTKEAFEKIISDLVYLEEENHNLIEYYSKDISERDQFNKLIGNYISKIEELIRNIFLSPNADNLIPFIIIGSEVVLYEYIAEKSR